MPKTPSRRRPRTPASGLPSEVALAIAAAQDKKALDLAILDLRKGAAFTDFFIICTGANTRQVQAIAEGVRDALAKKGTKPSLVEGLDRSEWVLVDYFDFVLHVFTPSTREFYALDRLWGDAERIEIPA